MENRTNLTGNKEYNERVNGVDRLRLPMPAILKGRKMKKKHKVYEKKPCKTRLSSLRTSQVCKVTNYILGTQHVGATT